MGGVTFWLVLASAVFAGSTASTLMIKVIEHRIHEARFKRLDAKYNLNDEERERLESLVKV